MLLLHSFSRFIPIYHLHLGKGLKKRGRYSKVAKEKEIENDELQERRMKDCILKSESGLRSMGGGREREVKRRHEMQRDEWKMYRNDQLDSAGDGDSKEKVFCCSPLKRRKGDPTKCLDDDQK